VTDIQWLDNDDSTKDILFSIEKQSEHPLAEAVVKHLEGVATTPLTKFGSITGKGAKADHNDETYFTGNKKLLTENNITIADKLLKYADEWGNQPRPLSGSQIASKHFR
jgi:Cu2+-exporting ATPase